MNTTPLRQQFIEILTLKGYSQRTIETYVSVVAQLARHHHRSPDQLSDQEVRAYLYHLHTGTTYSASTINVVINGLRFFYREVLHRSIGRIEFSLPRFRKRVRRPQAYSVDEVRQLLETGFTVPKHRTFFMTIYGAGLRLNEACHLKLPDIDSRRMLIRVRQGKGMKDRYTILPGHFEEKIGEEKSFVPMFRLQLSQTAASRSLDALVRHSTSMLRAVQLIDELEKLTVLCDTQLQIAIEYAMQ